MLVVQIFAIAMFSRTFFAFHGSKKAISGGALRMCTAVTVSEIKRKFRNSDAVCFDVDSTVIQDEGIDILAAFKGVGDEVAELTKKAMGGTVLFQDALSARLDLIKPSSKDIVDCLEKHPIRLTNGIELLILQLQSRGVHVYLVSGGFRQMIDPIARRLRIPSQRVYANNLIFDKNGDYFGFDSKEYTSRDGGKPTVIQRLKDIHDYKTVIMIGDGATDMQARPPADAFIGFGGIIQRSVVKAGADWFVTDFQELLTTLKDIDR